MASISSVTAISRLTRGSDLLAQSHYFLVLYVAPVLPEMHGYCVCAGILGYLGRFQDTRITRTARLSNGGDMIDIDTQ
jgi:hypothetical protein